MSRGMPQQAAAPTAAPAPAITREAQAAKLVGQLCTFFPRAGCVSGGLRLPNCPRYAGQIVAAKPLPATARGALPDLELVVRGRTGKTATVSAVENYVSIKATWAEALADT